MLNLVPVQMSVMYRLGGQDGLVYKATGIDHVSYLIPEWSLQTLFSSKYYNYTVSNQGVKEVHGDNYTLDYFTDILKTEAVKFIEEPSDNPIFMYIATPSPHRPATPAPQYDNKFLGKLAPRSPSYNDDSKDKHWIISDGMKNMLNDYPYLGVILLFG